MNNIVVVTGCDEEYVYDHDTYVLGTLTIDVDKVPEILIIHLPDGETVEYKK